MGLNHQPQRADLYKSMTRPYQPGRFIRFDSLELPEEQLERIEASAAEWSRSIEQIISEALDRYILSKTDSPAARVVQLPQPKIVKDLRN